MRPVTVGRSFGKRLVLDKGVQAGETVVTDGHLRLFPGAHVHNVGTADQGGAKP
jgi:membrane fusion protein, multidrug efflux system